ncbi:RadC family protein [Flavisphingomonas formosensis]|uniref:RadC family protein n=1 Tax=Flavisphingomonas formosensis TaxID=861534 RepID=UPI0012FBC1BA|nr:DNA repair protein RadC [Sphingomonas formosensis]
MNDSVTDGSGHRARLRQRLLTLGPEGLLDHELVEYLLALAIPRRDTKPLAKRLLAEFGGLEPLLCAEPESLARAGLGESVVAALKIAEAAALRLLRKRIADQPILSNWQALLDYLQADMAHRPIERVRVLHLNSRNMLIRDEMIAEGSIDQVAIHVREIVRRAIDLHSAALIIVHNHPSGDPQPSREDIRLTREVIDACRPLGIALHDHVVIGAQGNSSMRSLGLI